MSRILVVNTPRVKPTRRSPRTLAPFAAGLFARRERFQPSAEDAAWAAQVFGADADWDVRLMTGLETCEACGRPTPCGALVGGLCEHCEARAEEASQASLYYSAGLGYATA